MSALVRSQSLIRSFSTGNLSYLNRAEDVAVKQPLSKRWYVKGAIMVSVISLSWSATNTRHLYATDSQAFWKKATAKGS